jgi:hypothetical protein
MEDHKVNALKQRLMDLHSLSLSDYPNSETVANLRAAIRDVLSQSVQRRVISDFRFRTIFNANIGNVSTTIRVVTRKDRAEKRWCLSFGPVGVNAGAAEAHSTLEQVDDESYA